MRTSRQYSVTLPAEIADEMERKVGSGAYANVSDLSIDGVRAVLDRDLAIERWLREDVAESYDQYKADPSGAIPADQVLRRFRERAAARRAVSGKE